MTPEQLEEFKKLLERLRLAYEAGNGMTLDLAEVTLISTALVYLSSGARALIAEGDELERELEEARSGQQS